MKRLLHCSGVLGFTPDHITSHHKLPFCFRIGQSLARSHLLSSLSIRLRTDALVCLLSLSLATLPLVSSVHFAVGFVVDLAVVAGGRCARECDGAGCAGSKGRGAGDGPEGGDRGGVLGTAAAGGGGVRRTQRPRCK